MKLMYYDCNLYLFTFLVSYTVILVVYDCCEWFVLYPHISVQRGSCHFKVQGKLQDDFGNILTLKRPSGVIYDPGHIYLCTIFYVLISIMSSTMNLSIYLSYICSQSFTRIGQSV